MSKLKLGLPKGSLESATMELFAQAGWRIATNSRNYFPSIDDDEITCALVRPQEMAPYIASGHLDLALTGYDWILERGCEEQVAILDTLEYSKSSNQPCRWVLVVPQNSPIRSVQDLQGCTIATELEGFTRRFLEERGITAKVEFSWGATEAKVVEGLADAAVEITETGSTIRAHGLRIVEDLLVTTTRLIANKQALEDPFKRRKIGQIGLMLRAAMDARGKVALKMNVPKDAVESVIALLPSLASPTVSNLYRSDWLAVETVVERSQIRSLLPRLKQAGAQGILEYDLKKIV